MKSTIRRWCLAALMMGCSLAFAQDPAATYPSRPVTIVVVVTPGGSAETQSRVYTAKLGEALGKPIVFDHKPGAGGTIGYTYVAKSAPDGYTLLAGSNAFSTVPALMNLTYDPIKDFAPIALLGRQDGMLVVSPSLPVRTVQEYVAYAKANPGKLNWGTSGPGSTAHLTGAWMNDLTKTEATFVHYKGSELLTDLASGRIQVTGGAFINVSALVKSGKLRAIGMASQTRSPLFPDIPTMREQGIEWDYPSWLGFISPAGTPRTIVSKLNAELAKIQKMPETRAALDKLSVTPLMSTPEEFSRHLSEEIGRWKRLVQQTGIKLEG